jgi:wyosine [tRNA(Phe)-imidazoG37] synthetase (radical SAM superfamily)
MYKYLFGPVPSRRLGISLGIDMVPKKVCSLNCVYCEVGVTTKHTTKRMEYVQYDKVTSELEHYFANNPDPDYFTFSGSGEPTLNSRIGEVIQFVKSKKPHIPVAVLTNGTLLYDEEVQRELMNADLLLPSLDAATKEVFEKLNLPAPGLDFERYIGGLISFSKKFRGKIWLEVFILPGYNDTATELLNLKEKLKEIRYDSIQLNTLDRPGNIRGLRAATHAELEQITSSWNLENVEIIAAAPARKNIPSYRKDAESAILETIARRPCTLDDLEKMLGLQAVEINKYLDVLEGEEKIVSVTQDRGIFYQLKR